MCVLIRARTALNGVQEARHFEENYLLVRVAHNSINEAIAALRAELTTHLAAANDDREAP
jgi:hypothetical protein